MTSDSAAKTQTAHSKPSNIRRLKLFGIVLTFFGILLFAYFIYSVGVNEIAASVSKFGFLGFAGILLIYFIRVLLRGAAWKLSVYEPYSLRLRDTVPAVIIGEAMSSMIPLGILISGTSKAIAVRKHVPLVIGLSSIATENLFYSFTTSLFLILGSLTFLRSFDLNETYILTIDGLVIILLALFVLGIIMIVRQWRFASEFCEWLYQRGFATRILENGRKDVRQFEDVIYGFYRKHPKRFLPITLIELSFHLFGVLEVWFILHRISETAPQLLNGFLLESISRLITIIFKLVPFVVGVDEAGAQFVAQTVGIGAGVGIALAVIRKGRIMVWTAIGLILIVKRGLSFREISDAAAESID